MAQISLRRLVAGVLLTMLLIGGTVLAAATIARNSAVGAARQQSASELMLTAMLNQETGARGYFQTRDTVFLQPYREGASAFIQALSESRRFAAGDPALKQALNDQAGRSATGPLTEHAVRRFQAAHRLPVDGIAGPQTLIDLTSLPAAQRPRAASPQPRSRPGRARPKVAARRVRAPAPTPVRVAPSHGHSSPAKWLVLLAILALGVLLRAWRAKRSSSVHIPPPQMITSLPTAQVKPDSPSGALPEAEDDRAHREAAWQRTDPPDDLTGAQPAYRRALGHATSEETGRARAAVLELQRRLHTRSGRRER